MYPHADDTLARAVADALRARDATLAVAETTAGGLISARLLSVPGASAWFERGVIAYSAAAKRDLSPNADEILRTHGAVSREFVADLAEQLRASANTAYALAESGIAGPQTGRRSAKPVGSVVVAVAGPGSTQVEEHVFPGSRTEVMVAIADRALILLQYAIDGSQ
jgi:PncC family amidohydrolase